MLILYSVIINYYAAIKLCFDDISMLVGDKLICRKKKIFAAFSSGICPLELDYLPSLNYPLWCLVQSPSSQSEVCIYKYHKAFFFILRL